MKTKKQILVLFCCTLLLLATGCAVTLPTNAYAPQNFVRISGETEIGNFVYLPYVNGEVSKPNQIQNTAAGSMFISTDVASFVQRGNALELEKSGITLNAESPYVLSADIVNLVCDDLGYSIHWKYSIRYKFTRKSDKKVVYDRTFTPQDKKTGKFGLPMDYANVISEVVLSGYDMFIRDPNVMQYLQILGVLTEVDTEKEK